MKLTIRTKILGGYSLVIILFFAAIVNNYITQSKIGTRLTLINEDFLPKLTLLNSLDNYTHLDESFDVEKIIEAKNNTFLMQSIRLYHPNLLEKKLEHINQSFTDSLKTTKDYQAKQFFKKIISSSLILKTKHKDYVTFLRGILTNIEHGQNDKALEQNRELSRKKRDIKSEISLLRRRLDNKIKAEISLVSKSQKNASIINVVISLLAILFAGVITLFALYTLSPIRSLIEGVKKISKGDYNYRFEIKSEGEVKTLADEFNKMSQSILERNNRLREQQKKLLQSERMAIVGRMASHITHEIKNPLNSMNLNTELLEDEINEIKNGKSTQEALTLLKSIRNEMERVSTISDEYLSFARLPKGDKSATNLIDLLKELTSFLKTELTNRNIKLTEKYTEESIYTYADPSQLKKAFLNILKNAIEAIDKNGEITITSKTIDSEIEITIKDNGKGISPDIRENIFDPFFSTKESGTGLGLPLTQKIIAEQGGTIKCESSNGETFFIILLKQIEDDKSLNTTT